MSSKSIDWSNHLGALQEDARSIPTLIREDIRKSKMDFDSPAQGMKSLVEDPLAVQYALGYKDRRYSLTYDVLKRIPHQLGVVAAILQTRCNQVAAFSVPYRASKSVGFEIKHKDPGHETSKSELEFIQDLERFIYNCGAPTPNPHNKSKRDDFESFLKKLVRDSLTYDQACIEVVPDRSGQPYEFMAVDASTIRIASPDEVFGPNDTYQYRTPILSNDLMLNDNRTPFRAMQLLASQQRGERPEFVQVINGQIENVYFRNEMCFGVRNPRTDIYIQGYGYSELEQLISTLTAHLYAEEYNRRFFMQGSAPKGLLNFKGENFTPDMLEGFKRQWRANIEGVENCVAGSTRIITKEHGLLDVAAICGDNSEVDATVWTGTSWETGLVYKTAEPKQLCNTTFDNGAVLSTSPDHKIRVVRETGDPEWCRQNELRLGDVALVNKRDTTSDTQLLCAGKPVTAAFMALKALTRSAESNKQDKVPRATQLKYLRSVRERNKASGYTLLTAQQRKDLNSILSGNDGCSKGRLLRYLSLVELPIPAWLQDYNTVTVVALEATPQFVPMFDVSINHPDHMFMGEGVLISNSWKTPILQAEQGIEWIDLHPSNREMEFGQWMEYLIKITCFTGDTPVVTGDGSGTPIAAIEPGTLVRTHTGSLKRVVNVQQSNYEGSLVHVRAGEVIKTTPNHPFYVVESSYNNTTRRREFDEPRWKNASEIIEGSDYLLVPKKTYLDEGVTQEIDLTQHLTSYKTRGSQIAPKANRVSWIPRKLPLTESVAFVLGLYAAEGNSTGTAIYFTFSADEEVLQDAVVSVFTELGIHVGKYTTKETTRCVRVTSTLIALAFSSLFGNKAVNKKIPTELLTAPREVQRAFLSGLIAGDGSVPAFAQGVVNVTLSSVSDVLLEQTRHMLLQQDVYSSKYANIKTVAGFASENTMSRLDVNGTQAVKVSSWLSGVKGDRLRQRISQATQIKNRVYESPSYFMVPVSETWSVDYTGPVYNLEVEDEHTYQVNRFAVHNCAVFLIDPAELNFDLHGGVSQTPLFESSAEWKLKASRDRGLKPMLRFIARQINEHIINQIDDHFVFDFVGLDELTEQEKHELRQEQVASYMTLNEIRRAQDLPDVEDGDTILNPTYIQSRQIRIQQAQDDQAQEQEQVAQGAAGDAAPQNATSSADVSQQANTAPEYADAFRKGQESAVEFDLDLFKSLMNKNDA